MELDLHDKVAVVSGANRGIGAGVALQLAREGMRVALVARDEAKLAETAEAVRRAGGGDVLTLAHDLRRPEAAPAVIEAVVQAFGGLDLVVNNAGATRRGEFLELTDADWEDGFALKLHGYVRMARAAWPHLSRRRGVLVNIVGVGAWSGVGEFTIGGAVNAALMNFTKALAEVGKRDGVRVCAVNPGRIATERLERNLARLAGLTGVGHDEAARRLLAECGIERFGQPEEIGWAVAFLASARAAFAQGTLFDLDGGETRFI